MHTLHTRTTHLHYTNSHTYTHIIHTTHYGT